MKTLITTTALIIALGLPATVFAQSVAPADTSAAATSGFLAAQAMNQMLATDLIGHDVYARRTPLDMAAAGTMAMPSAAMATVTAADLDGMDNVGQINDLVLSNDGSVVALVLGVGGFLGVGERDVAVIMNEVSFAASADDPKNMYIVINKSGDMLKTSPMFDRVELMINDIAATAPATADQATAAASDTDDASALTELEAFGKVVFEEEIGCIECHGEFAKGDTGIGPNIQGQTVEYIHLQMQSNEMMMFDATDDQLEAVEAYLAYLKANKP